MATAVLVLSVAVGPSGARAGTDRLVVQRVEAAGKSVC
jgi:hypothetical protein